MEYFRVADPQWQDDGLYIKHENELFFKEDNGDWYTLSRSNLRRDPRGRQPLEGLVGALLPSNIVEDAASRTPAYLKSILPGSNYFSRLRDWGRGLLDKIRREETAVEPPLQIVRKNKNDLAARAATFYNEAVERHCYGYRLYEAGAAELGLESKEEYQALLKDYVSKRGRNPLKRFDKALLTDESVERYVASAYEASSLTLKEIAGHVAELSGMRCSASTVSRWARQALQKRGRKAKSRKEARAHYKEQERAKKEARRARSAYQRAA